MSIPSQAAMLRRFTKRRPNVALEWDSAQNKVVAKRAQVGLSWKQANSHDATCSDLPNSPVQLADGFDVPQELFDLPDLSSVLTVEMWETCLSESERELLSIYLPEGSDQKSAVEALLSGENLHFGNPLHSWGAAVCAEAIHPDVLLHREAKIKKERKAHLKRLRSYHGNMITNLQKMKEIWEECDNREELLSQIDRCMKVGETIKDHPAKNTLEPSKSVDFRERHWGEIREEFAAKQRHWGEVNEDIPAGQGHWGEFGGGRREVVDDLHEDRQKAKRRNSKPAEERLKRLKIKPLEDSREMNNLVYDFGGELLKKPKAKKRPVKTAEGGMTFLVTPSLERRDMGEAGESDLQREPLEKQKVKRRSIKNVEEGTKRLKIKAPEDGGREMKEVGPDFESEAFKKPKSKRQNTKTAEEGAKRLKIKSSEEGRDVKDIVDPELQRELIKKQQAKRGDTQTAQVLKKLKIKPSEEGRDIKEVVGGGDFQREMPILKVKKQSMNAAEGIQRLKIKSSEEGKPLKEVAVVDSESSKKNKGKKQPTKTAEEKRKKKPTDKKRDRKGPVDPDLEREWFDKYVEVTVGPLSDDKFLNAMQSVKVTRKMFDDVKLRSEAGEEVHIDMLDPMEESVERHTSKNVGSPRGDELELIAAFWRNVVLKDVPIVHANFIEKKEQQMKLAMSLASSCRNRLPELLQRFEITNSEASEEEAFRSRSNAEDRSDMTSRCSSQSGDDEKASSKEFLGKHFFAGSSCSEVDSVPSGYSVNEHHADGSTLVQNHFPHIGWSKRMKNGGCSSITRM